MIEAAIETRKLGMKWYELFSRFAGDLYPERYTLNMCIELAEQADEILRLAREKGSTIVAHNYLYPEFHEIAEKVGDSLGLSFCVKQKSTACGFSECLFYGCHCKNHYWRFDTCFCS
ncbi:MAG: quinolinate synthase NadA [Candidatus Kryptoniota bacterium]